MRAAIVVVALLAVGGCRAVAERQAVAAKEAADADCAAQSFKTAVALAQCRNNAMRLAAQAAGDNVDLINVATAQRLVLAEKVDRRQITQAEADLEMAKTMSSLRSTYGDRVAQERMARGRTCTTRVQFGNLVTDCN